jgi:hypothetical protein
MNLHIQLGSQINLNYVVAVTTAPKAYDGFGTITLAPAYLGDRDARLVLIREEHCNWQRGRYSSGMYSCCTEDGVSHYDESMLTEELYKRLTGQEDPT